MARHFDGTDDIIDCGNASDLNFTTGNFTLAGWFYPHSIKACIPLCRGSNGVDGYYSYMAADGYTSLALQQAGHEDKIYTAAGAFVVNVWQHFVWVRTGQTTGKIYKNNVEQGVSGSLNNATSSTRKFYVSSHDGIGNMYDGVAAEIFVYNRALTVGEIAGLYYGRPPLDSSLKLYLPLWGVASPEPDLTGLGHNGAVAGALVSNHAPIGRYVPYRFRVFPGAAGAEYINVTDSGIGTDTIVGIEEWLSIIDTGVGIDTAYLLGEVLIDGLRLDHALRIRVSDPTTIVSKPVSFGLPTRIYLGKQGRTLEIEGWVPTVAELNTISALADGAVHEIQLPTGSRVSVHILDVNPVRPITPGKYPYTLRAVERMD